MGQLDTGWTVRELNSGVVEVFHFLPDPHRWPTHSPVKWVPSFFLGGKAAEAWRLPPTSINVEVKESVGLYLCLPPPLGLRVLF